MTQRDKYIGLGLCGALVVGAALLFFFGYVLPAQELQQEIAAAQKDIKEKLDLIAQKTKEKRQMERFRMMSLTGAPHNAENDYVEFLKPLLEKCGLRGGVTPTTSRAGDTQKPGQKP